MDNVDGIISVLRTCLQVCIAFSILFFIISVVLFFVFDIRTIFNIRTGRAKKKTVREMQEANNKTGRLRVGGKTVTSQLSKADKSKAKKANKTDNTILPPPVEEEPFSPTEVLGQNTFSSSEYRPDSEPTTQLSGSDGYQNENIIQPVAGSPVDVSFSITKKIIIIHTDEVI